MKSTSLLRTLIIAAGIAGAASPLLAQGNAATGVTRVVKITHRDAVGLKEIVQDHLRQSYTAEELSRSAITSDPRTNSLIFRAASDQAIWLQDSLSLISQLDVAPPQATINIALVGRTNGEDLKTSTLEKDTARQNGWLGAVTLAGTRFIAGNEATMTTPLEAGGSGILFMQAGVSIVDADAKKVVFSSLVLTRPASGGSSTTTRGGRGDDSFDEMELENESRDHLRGETILGLNEVVLHGGAIQSLGPFPIGANGEQAMLVLRADFGPTDESMFGVIETRSPRVPASSGANPYTPPPVPEEEHAIPSAANKDED
jgi:hypothetical protein